MIRTGNDGAAFADVQEQNTSIMTIPINGRPRIHITNPHRRQAERFCHIGCNGVKCAASGTSHSVACNCVESRAVPANWVESRRRKNIHSSSCRVNCHAQGSKTTFP